MHASSTRQWNEIHPRPTTLIYFTEDSRESGVKNPTIIAKTNNANAVVQSTITLRNHHRELDVFKYWILAGIQMAAEIRNIATSDKLPKARPESDKASPSPANKKK